MSLKQIFSQDKAIGALQKALAANKLAHAYIFAGPDGVGKFATATEWGKVLLCNDPIIEKISDGVFYDSCGQCQSCKVFEGAAHPDYHSVHKELRQYTKDGKGKTTPIDMPIDVIREFLIEKVADRPMMSKRAVYVICEAEKLNTSSQNALLKVLEEPPEYCFIILLCSKVKTLLATTLSRCQVVQFGPVDERRIIDKLTRMGLGSKEATYWARFSEQSIGSAISWAGLELQDTSCYKIKKELVSKLSKYKLSEAIEFAEWLSETGKKISKGWSEKEMEISKKDITRRTQKGFLRMMIAALDDAMKIKIALDQKLVNNDQVPEIKAISSKDDVEKLAGKIVKAYENTRWVDSNVNEKLIFEELLLNFAGSGIIIGPVV